MGGHDPYCSWGYVGVGANVAFTVGMLGSQGTGRWDWAEMVGMVVFMRSCGCSVDIFV